MLPTLTTPPDILTDYTLSIQSGIHFQAGPCLTLRYQSKQHTISARATGKERKGRTFA